MPYIKRARREEVRRFGPLNAGDLAYTLYRTVLEWLPEERFEAYATAVGVLETVKLELFRRYVAPYEDDRLAEHGDVIAGHE